MSVKGKDVAKDGVYTKQIIKGKETKGILITGLFPSASI